MMGSFPGKVGLIQRVLPNYRTPFFNAFGRVCDGGLFVYAGRPRTDEFIKTADHLDEARLTLGKNLHLLSGQFYLCLQTGLLSWLSEVNPDVLIVEANPRYLSTRAAIRYMHQKQYPVIGWGLGAPPISGTLAPLRNFFRKQFIHQFDAMVTYSQKGAEEYAALGLPPEKIFVAVNAVTPAPTEPIPSRPDPDQLESAQILFVGRLQARKNIDILIRACANLPEGLQPNLVIVGEGPARVGLEDLAGQIYPKTIFAGALYGEALVENFKKADLFVLPGTGGLAIQQAMRYGLPIIAAQADGTQVDLVRPANGWIIPTNDIPALEAVLIEALADFQKLRSMGTESYRIVAEEINLEQMVATFSEALHRST
jgi:glycosyltransferase involved in cell wall biosynthesis